MEKEYICGRCNVPLIRKGVDDEHKYQLFECARCVTSYALLLSDVIKDDKIRKIIAECTKPSAMYCHKDGGYDKKHYQCLPCSFNSVAPYKKEMEEKIIIDGGKEDDCDDKIKVLIIGSHQYKEKMEKHKLELEEEGCIVKVPAFDDYPELDELGVCEHNRDLIRWAERIDLIWDQRSVGTIFDFGMVFMAEKPLHIVYLEPKTVTGVMEKYEKRYLY